MEWILTWIRNIACLYLILSVISNILPEVEEKKYIQFFGSLLVTICLLKPILQLGNMGERLEENVISNVLEEAYEEMKRETGRKDVVGEDYVRKTCEEEMRRQVEEWMLVYGYELLSCRVEFSQGEVMELMNLSIKIRKQDEKSSESDNSSQEEFIKNELINVYNIPEGNINISIQG